MSGIDERSAQRQMERLLGSWLDAPKPRFVRGRGDSEPDLTAVAGRHRFVVEFKRAGEAALMAAATTQARARAKRAGRSAIPVIVVP